MADAQSLRDRLTWLFALPCLMLLFSIGWSKDAFLFTALGGAGVSCASIVVLRSHGRTSGRMADALALAVFLFSLSALIAGLFGQLIDFAVGLTAPMSINPMEGREAFKAWLLANGQNIYAGPAGGNLSITLYGPLYYGLAALAERILGPGLFPARVISLLAVLALLVAVFTIVRRETGSLAASSLAAVALFASPLLEYGHFARPDMTAWALLFLAVPTFQWALEAKNPGKALMAAIILAVLALLAKQQTWAPLGGLMLYGLLRQRFRVTALFAAGTLVFGLIVFLALDGATAGNFLFQTIGYPGRMAGLADQNRNIWALDRLRVFLTLNGPDLALSAGYLASAVIVRRISPIETLLLACLAPLYFVLRWTGAEYNHFLPIVILAKAAGGILLARIWRSQYLGIPLAALVLALLAIPPTSLHRHLERRSADLATWTSRRATLDNILAGLPGPALSDAEAAYLFLGRPPRELVTYDAFETSIFERLGLVKPAETAIAQAIRARHFALVLTSPTYQPKALMSLLDLYYEPGPAISGPASAGPAIRRPRPEAAVLGFSGPKPSSVSQAGVTASLAPLFNLDVEPGFVTADGRSGPGRLVLALQADSPLRDLSVIFFPRQNLAEPASRLTLELETADGTRFTLWSRHGGGGSGWTPAPGDRTEVALPAHLVATARRLIFTLSGPAQLWFSPACPLLVTADRVSPR